MKKKNSVPTPHDATFKQFLTTTATARDFILLQKPVHQRDLAELTDRLATLLLAGHLTKEQVVSLVNYIVQAGETADAAALIRQLVQKVPQHGEKLMTIAEQLEQTGIKKA